MTGIEKSGPTILRLALYYWLLQSLSITQCVFSVLPFFTLGVLLGLIIIIIYHLSSVVGLV
jgi:hypothetical protein